MTVEADRAQRGRDLGDDAEVARALGDIEAFVLRVEAAAEVSGLPVEAAWLATARADAARAAGEPAVELWRESAAAWEAVERAYRVAVAQAREAEAEVAADDREARPRRRRRARDRAPPRRGVAGGRDRGPRRAGARLRRRRDGAARRRDGRRRRRAPRTPSA